MTPDKKPPDSVKNPDVEISATVKSRELRFEEVPETRTRFFGNSARESVSGTERENLPDEVKSGVTYRNSSVRLRIVGRLRDGGAEPEERPKEG